MIYLHPLLMIFLLPQHSCHLLLKTFLLRRVMWSHLFPLMMIPPPAPLADEIVPSTPDVEDVDINDGVKQTIDEKSTPALGGEEDADSSTGSRSSYVALVSPTGFVSSARDDTDASRRVFTNSLLNNAESDGGKLCEETVEQKVTEAKVNGTKKLRNNSGSSVSSEGEANSQVVS